MSQTTIYALTEPNGAIRYVGKTSQPLRVRYRAHLNRCVEHAHIPSASWIKELLARGDRPGVIVLECVDGRWESAEQFWIASFRATGSNLLNVTRGGLATLGLSPNSKTRARLSEAARQQFSDPSRRAAAAEYARQQWADPEFREKKTAHSRLMASSTEFREKQSKKKLAAWRDGVYDAVVEARRRRGSHRVGALRMWDRPEYKAAQAASRKRRYGKPPAAEHDDIWLKAAA